MLTLRQNGAFLLLSSELPAEENNAYIVISA